EADAYFATRARDSQLGAWASDQSRPLDCRETFEERFEQVKRQFEGKDVPRPPHWRGYRVLPEQIEFWSDRPYRLHERRLFTLRDGGRSEGMGLGIAVSLFAMAATAVLLWYQRRVIVRTGSVAILTDNVHYKSDLMLNGAVIVALVLDQAMHIAGADAIFGIAIALWLVWGAYRASSEAVNQLMDREWPEDERRV